MLATLMIPATGAGRPAVPDRGQTCRSLHISLLDSPGAIWLPSVANAFNIFLLKRFFDSIPEELMAAAAIDGAAPLRTLRRSCCRCRGRSSGVVSIFAVVAVWKDFLWPMLVEGGSPDHGRR